MGGVSGSRWGVWGQVGHSGRGWEAGARWGRWGLGGEVRWGHRDRARESGWGMGQVGGDGGQVGMSWEGRGQLGKAGL